jgi:hypothetical protein
MSWVSSTEFWARE